MRQLLTTLTLAAAFGGGLLAQGPTPSTVTQADVDFARFMLTELGDPNVSPKVVALYRYGLISQFGLNQQELGILDAAAATMKSSLLTMQANVHAITASKTALGASDLAALQNLDTAQNQVITSLASKILSSVRPESAARFRAAAQLVPNAAKGVH